MSQAVLASLLNVSMSIVQKWESPVANKRHSSASARPLQLLESKGSFLGKSHQSGDSVVAHIARLSCFSEETAALLQSQESNSRRGISSKSAAQQNERRKKW